MTVNNVGEMAVTNNCTCRVTAAESVTQTLLACRLTSSIQANKAQKRAVEKNPGAAQNKSANSTAYYAKNDLQRSLCNLPCHVISTSDGNVAEDGESSNSHNVVK